MATFSPYDKINKENVTVDFTSRVSPQKVVLINRENGFYGTFHGKAFLKDSKIEYAHIDNTELSNCSFFNEKGEKIDLSAILRVEGRVTDLEISCGYIFDDISELSNWCGQLSATSDSSISSIRAISSDLSSLSVYTVNNINNLWERISGSLKFIDTLSLDLPWYTEPVILEDGSLSIPSYYRLFKENFEEKGYPLSYELKQGYYFLSKSKNIAQKYICEGDEIENGDMIIIKNECVVSAITKNDVAIFDAQDTDVFHLSADNQIIGGENNHFLKKQIFNDISVVSENVDNSNINTLNATNVGLSNLTADNIKGTKVVDTDLSVTNTLKLTNTDIESDSLIVEGKANINVLTSNNISSTNETVTNLTVTNETVDGSNINTLNATNVGLSNLTADVIKGTKVVDTDLSVTNTLELTTTDTNVDSLIVNGKANINVLTSNNISSTNENVTNLTATNSTVTNEVVTNLSIESDKLTFTDVNRTFNDICVDIQTQILSNDSDINTLSNKVEFLLSVDHETVNYKGTLPFLSTTTEGEQLTNFVAPMATETKYGKWFKKGDLAKLSATQYPLHDICCDTLGCLYLGKDDFFIINQDVFLSDFNRTYMDIFRNGETEVSVVYEKLISLSNYTYNELTLSVDQISTVVTNVKNDIYTAETGISAKLDKNISNLNGLSSEVSVISANFESRISTNEGNIEDLQNDVSSISSDIYKENGISSKLDTNITNLNNVSVDIYKENGISSKLDTNISNLNDISSDIYSVNGISAKLDNTITNLNNISSDIYTAETGISAKVDTLKTFRENTFTKVIHEPNDISSDALIVTDESTIAEGQTHDRYYVTFLSGTMVMKPMQ